ncbi:MAG: hypothetical protein KIH10_06475 [Candidatus Freyarchaeota archaeon]|nr:hypothetical protein [Candidatus Jordarchaeia archaeon]
MVKSIKKWEEMEIASLKFIFHVTRQIGNRDYSQNKKNCTEQETIQE